MAEVNEAKREKSQVEDINRSLYDFRYEEKDAYKVDAGLTPAIVEQISREKNDPDIPYKLYLVTKFCRQFLPAFPVFFV